MKTIYAVGNDTSSIYFEDEDLAEMYVGNFGNAVGLIIVPIKVIQSEDIVELKKKKENKKDDE